MAIPYCFNWKLNLKKNPISSWFPALLLCDPVVPEGSFPGGNISKPETSMHNIIWIGRLKLRHRRWNNATKVAMLIQCLDLKVLLISILSSTRTFWRVFKSNHLFFQHLWSTFYVPGTVLCIEKLKVNKTWFLSSKESQFHKDWYSRKKGRKIPSGYYRRNKFTDEEVVFSS